jgi:hypothetical protein
MQKSLITALILLAAPAVAQDVPICNQSSTGQLVTDPAVGKPYVCDGAGNWIAADSMPHSTAAGEWRFNPQTRLMEYFDGQAWIAVQTQATR